jgi:hypothetical protein
VGVTIHYEGTVASDALARRVQGDALRYAREREWPVTVLEHGVVLRPSERCEPLELIFEANALVGSFVKTQFASADIHIMIVELFRQLQPLFQELCVEDEGGYWETGDRAELLEARRQVDELLTLALADPNSSGPHRLPSGRIVDVITDPASRGLVCLSLLE